MLFFIDVTIITNSLRFKAVFAPVKLLFNESGLRVAVSFNFMLKKSVRHNM